MNFFFFSHPHQYQSCFWKNKHHVSIGHLGSAGLVFLRKSEALYVYWRGKRGCGVYVFSGLGHWMRKVWVCKGWQGIALFLIFFLCTLAWQAASVFQWADSLGQKWEFENLLPSGWFQVQIVLSPSFSDDVGQRAEESPFSQCLAKEHGEVDTWAVSWPRVVEQGLPGDSELRLWKQSTSKYFIPRPWWLGNT